MSLFVTLIGTFIADSDIILPSACRQMQMFGPVMELLEKI